jgi:hypothetical protein
MLKLLYRFILELLPLRLAVTLEYYKFFKVWPNTRNPISFNEKVLWRKLHERLPDMHLYVDKERVKKIVAQKIGEDYIIPTLWAGPNPNDIPFDTLKPPYVIKANHGSRMDHFVTGPLSASEKAAIVGKCQRWLTRDHYKIHREWAYKDVERLILIEPFIGDDGVSPQDYRFWCFHGKVKMIQIDTDRRFGVTRAFFDLNWKILPIRMVYPQLKSFPKPKNLTKMIRLAEELSRDFSFVRVDFYNHGGRILFGELTFYPVGGYARFNPAEANVTVGKLWTIQ